MKLLSCFTSLFHKLFDFLLLAENGTYLFKPLPYIIFKDLQEKQFFYLFFTNELFYMSLLFITFLFPLF